MLCEYCTRRILLYEARFLTVVKRTELKSLLSPRGGGFHSGCFFMYDEVPKIGGMRDKAQK